MPRRSTKPAAPAPSVLAVPPKPTTAAVAGAPRFFNRELSWLAFNRRVLVQAQNSAYPLLERIRFLSFVSSNLDEFYEIRVAGLLQQQDANLREITPDGLPVSDQLRRIHGETLSLLRDEYACWSGDLLPSLKREGIQFKSCSELTPRELAWIRAYFEKQVLPVLTPLGVDPSHPFPQIANKTLNLLATLTDPSTGEREVAVIPVPRILPRVVQIGPQAARTPVLIFLSDILKTFASLLFPGYQIDNIKAFRVTRNSDLYFDEEEASNLLLTIEEELHKLRKGAAVRLEIEEGTEAASLRLIVEGLKLPKEFIFTLPGPINLLRLMGVYEMLDRPDLKFPPHVPRVPPELAEGADLFGSIRTRDILLHHPYDSFMPVVDFIGRAAHDPDVLAIKLTLYRTSSNSPIIEALGEASRRGKQVTVLIELKARFDEAKNILWARRLEEAGVHVVYGLTGLKTHCKCCLVVRREGRVLRRYAHIGTGNYHPTTAHHYTDLSLLTANEDVTGDVAAVFNALTGFARQHAFKKLLVAPHNLHGQIQKLIRTEADNARNGRPARIRVKCNSLVDRETIESLYAASRAGVSIHLVVRGICCLVPGVPGLSENITVTSILGRYLEHSRVFHFENSAGDPVVLLGSADWMPRNFFRRVEVVCPVEDPVLRQRLIDDILTPSLEDNKFSTTLGPDGIYRPTAQTKTTGKNGKANGKEPYFSSQEHFLAQSASLRDRETRVVRPDPFAARKR